jgi:hypothetical protein
MICAFFLGIVVGMLIGVFLTALVSAGNVDDGHP